ncbi:MAG: NTP transferase domain-containing protein [Candidatus Micrarchaeota archaeon]|nr:NTP transferase domain-containing protein [Candidatus Micrarchaeota archaeon]
MAITTAVVLAAGQGSRLHPLTYTRPKCMIQLAGKPILHHVLSNLKTVGVKRAVVVVGYMEKTVREYFAQNDVGLSIEFITQGQKYGTAAAFAEASKAVDSTFFAVAGDVITTPAALKALANGHAGSISALLKEVEHPEHYGIATVKDGFLASFAEKPASPPPKALVNCSLYVMEPSLFSALSTVKKSPRGEFEMTDVLKSQKVKAVVTSEYWLDMGMPWQLFNANEFLLSQLPEKRGAIANSTVKGKVYMEEGAQIIDSYVEGPLYVGKNTVIGPHAYVRGVSSIGANCHIGDSTTIKNAILFDHVNAKHLTYIGDSVIGAGCNFGAATQIANFRFDAGSIKAKVEEVVIDTQRHKLGAIIGDEVKMGVLCSVMPGKMIGDHCWIGANVMVSENVERYTHVQLEQKLSKTKIKQGSQ